MSLVVQQENPVYPEVSKTSQNIDTLPFEMGQALVFIAVQPALASMQMSSRFDITISGRSQLALDQAARDLFSFIIIAIIWSIGTSLVMYVQFGWRGLMINAIGQLLILFWIYRTFRHTISDSAERYGLNDPSIFSQDSHIT